MIKDARCIAVYGRRGSGKSTLADQLVGNASRVVVFDPMREFAREKGYFQAETLEDVLQAIKRGWDSGFRIAYTPKGAYPEAVHHLAKILWLVQYPYEDGSETRKLLFVIDEMNLCFPRGGLPKNLQGLMTLVNQGRHRGLELIGVALRPASISADFRGQVAETYVLPLSQALDYKAVTDTIGREHEPKIRGLKVHEWLHFKDGALSSGRNKPLKQSRKYQRKKSS